MHGACTKGRYDSRKAMRPVAALLHHEGGGASPGPPPHMRDPSVSHAPFCRRLRQHTSVALATCERGWGAWMGGGSECGGGGTASAWGGGGAHEGVRVR